MKFPSAAAALLLGASALVGCRNNPQMDRYIETLNAEKRMLEDQVYELQYDYESKVRELEKLKAQFEPSEAQRGAKGPAIPKFDEPGFNPSEIPDVGVPELDVPEFGAPDLNPGELIRPGEQPDSAAPDPNPSTPMRESRTSESPSLLILEPAGTGPFSATADYPAGLAVSLIPANERRRPLRTTGPVSVVVRTQADKKRIARWEFTQAEVREALQRNRGDQIQLEMAWPEGFVANSEPLELFVRFTGPDGSELQASRVIYGSAERLGGWTPRSLERRQAADPQAEEVRSADRRSQNEAPRQAAEKAGSRPPAEPPSWTPDR